MLTKYISTQEVAIMKIIRGYLVVAQAEESFNQTLWGAGSPESGEIIDHFLYGELRAFPRLTHAQQARSYINTLRKWRVNNIIHITMRIAKDETDLRLLNDTDPSVFITKTDMWFKIFGVYDPATMSKNSMIQNLRSDGRCDITVNGLVPFPPLNISLPKEGCINAGNEYGRQSLHDYWFATWYCRVVLTYLS